MTNPGVVQKAFEDAQFWLSLPMNKPIVQLLAIILSDMNEMKARITELEKPKG